METRRHHWYIYRGSVIPICLIATVLWTGCSGSEEVLFSCGFETDFCGLIQQTDDDIDWTRHSGPTSTPDTGPESAYTGDYYIYMEASEATDYNSLAIIETADLSHEGQACLTFAYHLFGEDPGYLSVYTTVASSSKWYASGNIGNHWSEATVELNLNTSEGVQFYARVGHGKKSDIAIDDVIIRTGSCKRMVYLPYACSFENGYCGMTQSNSDDLDWTRYDSETGSPNTGPSRAYDGQWFLYIESDLALRNWNKAYIETPGLDHTGDICVRFKYHMYGANVGRLVLLHQTIHQIVITFEDDENRGDQWNAAEITVPSFNRGDWITFLGSRGTGVLGDIAVDDILISAHDCNDTDECVNGHQCSQQCHNTPGSYTCSCGATYILAQDGVDCIDCQAAYQKVVNSSQAFSSDCPTSVTKKGLSLQTCLLEACKTNASLVAFVNEACSLKQCPEGDPQLVAGIAGWDIYMLKVTWSGESTPARSATFPLDARFPLWQVFIGVFIGSAVVVALVVGVISGRRSLGHFAPARDPVQYENSPWDTAQIVVPNPELPADGEGGVYSQITETSIHGVHGDRDNSEV